MSDELIRRLREPRAGTHYVRDENDVETGETVDEYKRFEVMQAEREEAADALARLESQNQALQEALQYAEDAIRVYTSRYHGCSTRPCSCGAYSALGDVLVRNALSPTQETDPE